VRIAGGGNAGHVRAMGVQAAEAEILQEALDLRWLQAAQVPAQRGRLRAVHGSLQIHESFHVLHGLTDALAVRPERVEQIR